MAARIAVIGDLHSAWDEQDVEYFNASDYRLLLFTGDLGASSKRDGQHIAQSIARVKRDVLVMPGNNDVAQLATLGAELTLRQGARSLLLETLAGAPKPEARLCGYSSHSYLLGQGGVTVIAGRPFSFGGGKLWFAEDLAREFGITSLEASAERIVALAQQAPTRDVIFLSHNGPTGLGEAPDAPWGNDFDPPPAGDWGDPDLRAAIDVVKAAGEHRVLCVIAGHMHWPTRGGGERRFSERIDGTLYLNPARVPRIVAQLDGALVRHHFALRIDAEGAHAEERAVDLD